MFRRIGIALFEYAIVASPVAVASLLFIPAALAAEAAPADTGNAIVDSILAAIGAALPGLILGGWAWFKAHAAQSEAAWDDWMVARVKDVARGVVNEGTSGIQPPKTL